MDRLYEKLKNIKKLKKEKRLGELQEICRDSDIINDALEITKMQSSITLPGTTIILAIAAVFFSYLGNVVKSESLRDFSILLIFIFVLVLVYKIMNELGPWMDIYYDLIELRMMRREDTKPTVISKLDIIISKVEAINPRIDVLEKNVSTKIEAIEKEVMNIKKK